MFKPLGGSLTQEVVLLTGKFAFSDGSGNVDTLVHAGFSVAAANSDGEQVITLDDTYNDLVGISLTYAGDGSFAAAESTVSEVSAETVSTDRTITIQHVEVAGGGKQTQANLNGKTVRCMIWLKNSGI
jgi:hypothetical protein